MKPIVAARQGIVVAATFVLCWHSGLAQEYSGSGVSSRETPEVRFSSLVFREGMAYVKSGTSVESNIRSFTGAAVCLRATGQVWLSGNFVGGRPNGQWQLRHENQALSVSAVLMADRLSFQREAQPESLENCERMASPDGAGHTESFVNLTTSDFKRFHDNGQTAAERGYLNGVQEGPQSFWYANGQPRMQYTYENGELNGWFRYWHATGQLLEESAWHKGRKEGVTRRWYESGQLQEQTSYSAGVQDGLQRTWYRNGQLLREATYRSNELEGISRTWNESGSLRTQAHKHNGEHIGPRRLWYANGRLAQEINYTNGEEISCERWTEAGDPIDCSSFPPPVD